MTARLVQPFASIDDGLTVAEASRVLGCDQTTVRALIRDRQLHAWRVGKGKRKDGTRIPPNGVRISSESCLAYRERNTISYPDDSPTAPPAEPPKRPPRQTAVLNEALAAL